MDGYPKTAACACGALTATASAPPKRVHASSCLDCQRRTGSAFSLSAFFPETALSTRGEVKSHRRIGDAGRYVETNFCPTCGATVFSRVEAMPGLIAVPVGSFADPAFEKPRAFYWTLRRHRWLVAPEGAATIERQ